METVLFLSSLGCQTLSPLPCSCIRSFGKTTQHTWLWLDVLSDLGFLLDLCLLLLSAYYTDRDANDSLMASQSASVEAAQHSQTNLGPQQQQHIAAFDRKMSKPNLAGAVEPGHLSRQDLTRTMSRTKSKRDMTFTPGFIAAGAGLTTVFCQFLAVRHAEAFHKLAECCSVDFLCQLLLSPASQLHDCVMLWLPKAYFCTALHT